MDKVVEVITIAEIRCNDINAEIKELEAKLQQLKDERHVLLAVLEAAKKAEHEVAPAPKAR